VQYSVHGKRPRGVTAKDLIIASLGKNGQSLAATARRQYGGAEAIRSIYMAGRLHRRQMDY